MEAEPETKVLPPGHRTHHRSQAPDPIAARRSLGPL